jgi:hypothetical protein
MPILEIVSKRQRVNVQIQGFRINNTGYGIMFVKNKHSFCFIMKITEMPKEYIRRLATATSAFYFILHSFIHYNQECYLP